ncbi:hypothetical protein E2C01_033458 [Portunus trituberculatus]|uniref:Uncharacterized protein n=1 Tax=Portunus trituberculatus TaxID=210409 RepID=A0A5B7F3H5_PORTR|nr:hypothetical protein [Portunus trituberculatus]
MELKHTSHRKTDKPRLAEQSHIVPSQETRREKGGIDSAPLPSPQDREGRETEDGRTGRRGGGERGRGESNPSRNSNQWITPPRRRSDSLLPHYYKGLPSSRSLQSAPPLPLPLPSPPISPTLPNSFNYVHWGKEECCSGDFWLRIGWEFKHYSYLVVY